MQIKNASGPGVLIPDQLRLLNELASSGGVQIIRHHRDQIHYEALEQKSFIGATELSENEIRYNITSSGRTVLAGWVIEIRRSDLGPKQDFPQYAY